jgi:hypothetical protein
MEINSEFVIKTRRVNRSVVYVNICSCPAVPANPKGFEKEDGIIFMVIGEVGVTANDHSVFDIAVNPAVTQNARKKPEELLSKVSGKQSFSNRFLIVFFSSFSSFSLFFPSSRYSYVNKRSSPSLSIVSRKTSPLTNWKPVSRETT